MKSLASFSVKAAVALSVSLWFSAALAGDTVGEYRPMPMMGGGYSNKMISVNRWKVRGFSVEDPLGERSMHLALYRGALIERLQGFAYMQVVNADQSKTWLMGRYANSNSVFVIVGIQTADVPLKCEAKGRFAELCRTLSVSDAISTFGHLLGKNDQQISRDYDELKSIPPKGYKFVEYPITQ